MDLVNDIRVQGIIVRKTRVIRVLAVVLAALAVAIVASAQEARRKRRKRKRDELLKRKDFKKAIVYKRQLFQCYNDLAEGSIVPMPQETEEGHPMDEALDRDDDGDFATPIDISADLGDDLVQSNESSVGGKQRMSPSSSRKLKRKKASVAGLMDVIFELINKLREVLTKPQIIEVDRGDLDNVLKNVYDALKAIPQLSQDTMLKAYGTFSVETTRAKGFLRMSEEERVKYIQMKFG